jgi:hypothetical protein
MPIFDGFDSTPLVVGESGIIEQPSGIAPAGGLGRETDVYRDIERRLLDSGLFAVVRRHGPTEGGSLNDDITTAVYLDPYRGQKATDADGGQDVEMMHDVTFRLTICVKDTDPTRRDETLDRLKDAACNLIDGQKLANLTFPPFTGIDRWIYAPVDPPWRLLVLEGSFRYATYSYAGNDTADESDYL